MWTKQRQIGAGLILLGFLILLYVFIFLSHNVLAVKGMPELLPDNKTVFFAQFDLQNKNLSEEQRKTLKAGLTDWLKEIFQIKYADLSPFMTGLFGVAQVLPVIAGDAPVPVFIAELKKEIILPGPFQSTYKKVWDAKSSNNFLIVSPLQKLSLAALPETSALGAEVSDNLASSYAFLQTLGKIPADAFSYFYAQGKYYDLPWSTMGGFLTAQEAGFFISGRASGNVFTTLATKSYDGSLLKFMPSSPQFFLGGVSFENTISVPGFPTAEQLKPLRPIFQDEYGLSVYDGDEFLFIGKIGGNAPAFQAILENSLAEILSIMAPDIRTVTLPDGTKGREYVIDKGSIQRHEEKIRNMNVIVLKPPRGSPEFLYMTRGNYLFISSSRQLLERSLGGENFVKEGQIYQNNLAQVLRGVHEIGFLEKTNLKKISPILQKFSSLSLGVRYGENPDIFFGFLAN